MALQCIVSVECAIEYQQKFLIIQRPQNVHAAGLLAFPGGGFELADAQQPDALITAAKREVFEEVGLDLIDQLHYVTSSCFADKYARQIMHVVFYCKIEKTAMNLKISEREVANYSWLSLAEVSTYSNCPEWLIRYLDLININLR